MCGWANVVCMMMMMILVVMSAAPKVSTCACGKNRPVTLPPKVRHDRYKF